MFETSLIFINYFKDISLLIVSIADILQVVHIVTNN